MADTRTTLQKRLDTLVSQTGDDGTLAETLAEVSGYVDGVEGLLTTLTTRMTGFAAAAAKTVTSSANAAATITLAAPGAAAQHALSAIHWSYSAAATAGTLTISAGATTVLSLDLGAAVRDSLLFDPVLLGGLNAEVVITLGAGGAGIIGKLNVHTGAV
jgi:hypothetical protein